MAAPTTGTPLEIAKRYREEETKKLMGFGENSPAGRQDLAVMQEVQNLFNAHKTTGSRLLQAGRITTEEYYASTRQAGIKLGIINEDEYPDNLPDYLKPTLEIGGAVIGGVIGGLAGLPGGVGGSLAGESVGAGIGSATGTAAYAMLQDFTAPDGMPTTSWEDRGVGEEALREGALVTGLTAGIGGIMKVGGLALQSNKISSKGIDNLTAKGRGFIQSVLGSKAAQKLGRMKNGYLIEEQQKADDLMLFLREQGITPNLSMIIDNDTVRSLVYALGRTPLLGTPARESYDRAKNELFERIAYGVKNDDLDKALSPLTDKFIKKDGQFVLKDGVKLDQVDDMGSIVNFINYSAYAQKNIKTMYDDAERSIKGQKYNINENFARTKALWAGFNTLDSGIENFSKNGRVLTDLLSKETNEMAEILFGKGIQKEVAKDFDGDFLPKKTADKHLKEDNFVTAKIDGVDYEMPEDIANLYTKLLDDGTSTLKGKGKINNLKKYSKRNLEVSSRGSGPGLDPKKLSSTARAFDKKETAEQLVIFKRQLDNEYAEASYYASRLGSSKQDNVFAGALGNLKNNLQGDLVNSTDDIVARKLIDADNAYIANVDRIRNSHDIIKRIGYYQFDDAGEEAAKYLSKSGARKDVLDRKLDMGALDKNGDLLDNAFKTRKITTADGRSYFEYLKTADGKRIAKTKKEQLQVPGISSKVLDDIIGGDSRKSGDLVLDLFQNGTPSQLRAFKETVGDKQFRKSVISQFENDVNETIIQFINGKEGEAAAALTSWFKRIGVGDAKKTARYQTMIDEAGLAFKYDDLVQMTRMMELLPTAPALNQFIQRSMMLRFSQGIGPGAIGGLFGLSAAGAGASAGLIGSAAGLGALYLFNKLMASPITQKSVAGIIARYKSAVASGSKEKADEASKEFLGLMDRFSKPFQSLASGVDNLVKSPITPGLLKQTGINLGALEYFE
jgi:hypothetical protein